MSHERSNKKIASDHQKKQADAFNTKRALYDKPIFEVGDIGIG